MKIRIDQIRLGRGPAPGAAEVARLVESISEIDLHTPIAVLRKDDVFVLRAGRTRLEACKKLGHETIEAEIFTDPLKADAWAVAENLHRKDLDKVERARAETKWVTIMKEKQKKEVSAQVALKPERNKKGGRPSVGLAPAAREAGIPRDRARRNEKIAALSPRVVKKAEQLGLTRNQSALLGAAAQSTDTARIKALEEHAAALAARKARRDVPPAHDGNAYPTGQQLVLAWFAKQHPATRENIIAWIRETDTDGLIEQLLDSVSKEPTVGLH